MSVVMQDGLPLRVAGFAASRGARLGCFWFCLVEAVEGGHLWCVANVPSYGMKKRGGDSIPRSFALTVAFVVGADRLFWMSSLAGRPDGMTAT